MKTQVAALAILLLAGTISAAVQTAKKSDDISQFIKAQKLTNNVFGLYFHEKDESPIFSAITGLFSPDKEKDFQNLLNNNGTFQIMKVDTRIADLKTVATQMKIPSYPYAVVYFDKNQTDVVQGPADEDTAIKILEHRKPAPPAPKPAPAPPKPTPPPPAPAPKPVVKEEPKPYQIKDLNRPIEEDDSYRQYPATTHVYDWVDPINQFVGTPTEFVQVVPEVVLPAVVPQPAPVVRTQGPPASYQYVNYPGPQTIWQQPQVPRPFPVLPATKINTTTPAPVNKTASPAAKPAPAKPTPAPAAPGKVEIKQPAKPVAPAAPKNTTVAPAKPAATPAKPSPVVKPAAPVAPVPTFNPWGPVVTGPVAPGPFVAGPIGAPVYPGPVQARLGRWP